MKLRLQMLAVAVAIVTCESQSHLVANEPAKVDFVQHIAPIVHSKCTGCHRQGQSGPFELRSFDDVRSRAATIQAVIHDQYMPPWKLVNEDIEFAHDRRLTEQEIQLLDKWIDLDMPAGDLSQLDIPVYKSGWSLGEPDAVLKMNGRFQVPADGPDLYRSFLIPASFTEDKWVKAVELRPKARGALHHALFFVDTTGEAKRKDGQDGKAGLSGMRFLRTGQNRQNARSGSAIGISGLGGYVPGTTPNKLPQDLAMYLPAGGDIVMQTHFHPSGKVEWEEAELALYFANEKPTRQMVPVQMPPLFGRLAGIDVAPGEDKFVIHDSYTLPVDVEGVQIGGHAHYICREMSMKATLPSGEQIELLTIDDWDLDWQDQYLFKSLVPLAAGTKLDVRLRYDNSADNPENPHSPPKRIKWGRESTDEMGSVTLLLVAKNEDEREQLQSSYREHVIAALTSNASNRMGNLQNQIRDGLKGMVVDGRLIKFWDRNRDGKLQQSEIPQRYRDRVLSFADQNDDGVLDKVEIARAQKLIGEGK